MSSKKKRRDPGNPLYQPVSTRLWNDKRFLALSDTGRALWVYLLTSSSLPIPGVVIAGEATVAETLDGPASSWDVERVRKGVAELVAQKFKFRWEGRVVWLINATKHKPIAGPNQIVAMGRYWGDVPDVSFKRELWMKLREASKNWSKVFAEHIEEPVVEGVSEPLGGTLPTTVTPQDPYPDPEQDPEQQQPPAKTASLSALPNGFQPEATNEFAGALMVAERKFLDMDIELAKFSAHARAMNWKRADWTAAFSKWLLDAKPATAAERQANAQWRKKQERSARAVEPGAVKNIAPLSTAELAELERMAQAIAANADEAAKALRATENANAPGDGGRRVLDGNPRDQAKEATG